MRLDNFYELINEFNYRIRVGNEPKRLYEIFSVCRNEIVPTMLTDNEIQLYRFIVNQRCQYNEEYNIVEIGSHLGGSTFVLSTQLSDINSSKKIYSIDPHMFMGDNTKNEYNRNLSRFGLNNVIPIYATSTQQLKTFNDKIDFLFIDGNHTYPYVKEDLESWYNFVVDGGFIILHDYNDFSVHKQQDEFMKEKSYKDFYIETGFEKGVLMSSIMFIK